MPTYDPEALGARCSECSLRTIRVGGPVGPERHAGDMADVISETPGEKECNVGRPLVGPGGMEFTNTLTSIGVQRTQVALHHAIACAPPEGDLDKVMLRWQRANKKLVEEGEEPVPSPIDCCRPRLLADLRHPHIITLGKTALHALTGKSRPVLDIRGGPMPGWFDAVGRFHEGERPVSVSGTKLKVMPTLHPGHVVKARRWARAFQTDLARAFRWFRGQLNWSDPVIVRDPTPMQLVGFLSRNLGQPIIYDVETTFDDPTVAKLKCVGLSTMTEAMVVHLLSIEGPNGALVGSHYRADDEVEIRRILREFFADPAILKVGHNAGYFDRMVIEQHFGVTPAPLLDTILLHRSVESELPHRLAYVGSVYTDVTSWKDAHTAKEASSDEELGVYCAIDCCVTARVLPPLAEAAKLRGQEQVVERDHRVQEVCVGMHQTGMLIDGQRVQEETRRVMEEMNLWRQRTLDASGRSEFNANSPLQIRSLIFDSWKMTPAEYTKSGDPSTADDSLRLMRTQNSGDKRFVTFVDALRRYRRAAKEFGTYLKRMVPYGQPVNGVRFESDEEQNEAARGLIMADGRVRPDYNAHGTTSGRLSSSNPNAQNWPKHLRGMVIAQPGCVLVGADADQLELRIITAVAQIAVYLEAFAQGKDPHAMTASLMFGKAFDVLEPKSDQWDKLRKIAKGIKYASFYGSGDETVHGLVTSAEDEQGNLMYPDLSVREISTLRRRWLDGIPELPRWWDDCLDEYRNSGFILDPVWLRRRDFLDGEKFNEIVNFPIQSAGSAIIHDSTFDLLKVIPFGKWGKGTGLIAQVHDALYVEAPCPHPQYEVPKLANGKPDEKQREFGWCPIGCTCEANWSAREIEKAMNRSIPGLDGVPFKAKAKIGARWSDV
jgi:DNA polymerase I-like protein with 3'-5' exonuclease and polymerase domains/uracil-DNA glycosylase